MSNNKNPIGWLVASGSPFEIGHAMGQQGRAAVHEHLIHADIWSKITGPHHAVTVTRLMQNTKSRFPEFYEELRGLAQGLGLPFQDVFAWNCRGDILASTPDGCTTIQSPGDIIRVSHNEDGLPFFRGHCFILDAKPQDSLGFRAFCYPGSLAGHTFGWNDAGLVQAVNNLRLQNTAPMVPRMVLGRAVLASATLQGAVNALTDDPKCGGFHMTLAQAGNPQLLSVEYGDGKASVVGVEARSGHANHALHLAAEGQIITQSSADRQSTAERLVTQADVSDLDILRDVSGPGLPIRRDAPNDPDHENTLATCQFTVSKTGIEWGIYGEKEGRATYQCEQEIA
ncbi:6-aminopenicillanic acid acyl-transferase [Pseudorhodobacter turbinis]|uniref:6-aminopenicillanic acid acyl-transferase n=1 Tax=Pseudorhodobacter turbinis TaxID=2500533 RepID=A0A4P8ED47_9RHOB|nr:C45 family peptidase [Pseudorhodobacter turbinis]QCO54593.1 6-aminopenicillanic acid acyl-transferase [Pseudorhodobacter turbinis]